MIFWEDVYAVRSSIPGYPHRVGPPRPTSASLLALLQKNPVSTVSKPRSGKIGTIHARVVDIGVSDGAVNDDPGCPAKPCADFLFFPQWGEAYGIAGKWISRFYFSDVRYGGTSISSWPSSRRPGKAELGALLPTAQEAHCLGARSGASGLSRTRLRWSCGPGNGHHLFTQPRPYPYVLVPNLLS